MVAAGRLRLPQLVQLAGQAAGSAEHHIGRPSLVLHHAHHLRIGGQRIALLDGRGRVGLGEPEPRCLGLRRAGGPARIGCPATERRAQLREPGASIGDERLGVVLGSVEGLGVEADDPPPLPLEQRP